MTLLDYINAADGPVIGFLVGVGFPAGIEIVLNDPDFDCPLSEEEMGQMEADPGTGKVDIWSWDGNGPSLADHNGNTIYNVQAWVGDEADVARITK